MSIDGTVPLVSNSSIDNGVMGFSNLRPTNKGNSITCSDTTLGADTMYYQERDFIGYSHIQHFVPKMKKFNKKIAQFIISCCRIATTKKYDYGRNFYVKDADNLNIQLPTKDNKPDYKTMEIIISAIHKLVIKEVVLYEERKIEATKKVVISN